MTEHNFAFETIHLLLREAISKGDIENGSIIRIGDIAKLTKTSRSPVKQAFDMLAGEGLIRPYTGQGYVVGSVEPTGRVEISAETLGIQRKIDLRGKHDFDELYFSMERDIILNSMHGGLRINELALARHYNIGRLAVRDLLHRANRVGIVTRVDGSWEVVHFSENRCRNLYHLRYLLEPEALHLAYKRIPKNMLDEMLNRLDTSMQRIASLSIQDLDELESDLHLRCLSYCPNNELIEALQRAVPTYICGKYLQVMLTHEPAIESFMVDHKEIVTSLLTKDCSLAVEHLRGHIARSTEQIVLRLKAYLHLPPPPSVEYIWRN